MVGTRIKDKSALKSTEWLCVKDLLVSETAQRIERPMWAAEIAADFDPNLFGIIHVSRRSNGKLFVIDGQQRLAALRIMWPDTAEAVQVECRVYENLSIAQEAEKFQGLNHNLRVGVMDLFRVGVTAREPIPTAILKLVTEAGYEIRQAKENRVICAVSSLRLVYSGFAGHKRLRRDDVSKANPDLLRTTLRVLNEAWNGDADACNGFVIEGVARLLAARQNVLDLPDLIGRLQRYPGGARALLGKAMGRKSILGGRTSQCVAEEALAAYNKGRTTHKVEALR
jgi:hypothetical protein